MRRLRLLSEALQEELSIMDQIQKPKEILAPEMHSHGAFKFMILKNSESDYGYKIFLAVDGLPEQKSLDGGIESYEKILEVVETIIDLPKQPQSSAYPAPTRIEDYLRSKS